MLTVLSATIPEMATILAGMTIGGEDFGGYGDRCEDFWAAIKAS